MNRSVVRIELKAPATGQRRRQPVADRPLLPYFFAGPENRLAAFVCGGRESIVGRGNPLLLIGPSGSGKSALAATLAAAEAEHLSAGGEDDSAGTEPSRGGSQPKRSGNVLWMPAIDFARRYAEAVDGDDIEHFRQPLRQAEILLLDDVHLIADKGAAQEELASRLAERLDAGRVTILTCRRLPTEIRGFRPLLASRMLPGLAISVALPGAETRPLLLRALADEAGLVLDDALLELLAAGLPAGLSAPRLAASIQHLRLWCRNAEGPLTSEAIQGAIDAAANQNEPTIPAIAGAVARRFKLRTSDLKGPTRRQQVVRARALAMFLGRKLTDRSLQQIGDYFGGRDHTTVLHACRKTESLLGENPELSRAADEVTETLRVSA
ncbi:helix-turn-helix domain-containing protein [Candidatus Laterigemmans baculatus]|uniref:helix-turn-helix domain-containing protein n=1 Tax=Candidatus Laterigemmans baculatus TaxID=2770505 RepID=UPI0013DB450B|nr:helix-turn-helix domain-containing protein [Candidatus Laterigemmans baculatus]